MKKIKNNPKGLFFSKLTYLYEYAIMALTYLCRNLQVKYTWRFLPPRESQGGK